MDELVEKNQQLQSTLDTLLKKAGENQLVFQRFNSLEQNLLSCGTMDDLLHMLLEECKLHFDVDSIELVLFDPDRITQELLSASAMGLSAVGLRFTEDQLMLRKAFNSDFLPLIGPINKIAPLWMFPQRKNLKSCILLPLTRNNMILGSFHLASNASDRFTDNMAYDFMKRLASIIAVCLENCVNQESLRRLCMIDMLTRVGNRRAFDLNMATEISRASRHGRPLSCLFMDLDHFKQVNDTHGHLVGDQALRSIAQEINLQLRQTDHLARYGGEEFAALLPDCDSELACHIAERIRKEVGGVDVRTQNGLVFQITISVGVSTCFLHRESERLPKDIAHALLECADRAVYMAKKNGRDQIRYLTMDESVGLPV